MSSGECRQVILSPQTRRAFGGRLKLTSQLSAWPLQLRYAVPITSSILLNVYTYRNTTHGVEQLLCTYNTENRMHPPVNLQSSSSKPPPSSILKR